MFDRGKSTGVRVTARRRGTVLCATCGVADRPLARMRGLLGRDRLEPGEGLLLRPAPSIHTLCMRFPIDAVFLDRDDRVLRVVAALGPWRAASCRGARAVIELAAGAAEGLSVGDALDIEAVGAGHAAG